MFEDDENKENLIVTIRGRFICAGGGGGGSDADGEWNQLQQV